MLDYRTSRGIAYFSTFQDARTVRNALRNAYPDCRIVRYDLGYAVQRERSGPYLVENSRGAFSFIDRRQT